MKKIRILKENKDLEAKVLNMQYKYSILCKNIENECAAENRESKSHKNKGNLVNANEKSSNKNWENQPIYEQEFNSNEKILNKKWKNQAIDEQEFNKSEKFSNKNLKNQPINDQEFNKNEKFYQKNLKKEPINVQEFNKNQKYSNKTWENEQINVEEFNKNQKYLNINWEIEPINEQESNKNQKYSNKNWENEPINEPEFNTNKNKNQKNKPINEQELVPEYKTLSSTRVISEPKYKFKEYNNKMTKNYEIKTIEKPIAMTEAKTKPSFHNKYNAEIEENHTPNKEKYESIQRNKIKSMYESQTTRNSSNSKEFLNKFKKVCILFYFYLFISMLIGRGKT